MTTTVYPFSEFQTSFLRGLFRGEEEQPPHNTKVRKIAITDGSVMVIEYDNYNELETVAIPHSETRESFHNKHIKKYLSHDRE